MSDLRVISTGDGSKSVFNQDLNETYHSTHGAISESRHVFLEHGLKYCFGEFEPSEIKILEIGMGTGLNVLLSIIESRSLDIHIKLLTLEPYPLSGSLLDQINYVELLGFESEWFRIHDSPWEEDVSISDKFSLHKSMKRLEEFNTDEEFDVVYMDAFAPNKQPEIWDPQNLYKLRSIMHKESILVTYCAQGQFRRNLVNAGFDYETLPGPPGKKEMTRAFVS